MRVIVAGATYPEFRAERPVWSFAVGEFVVPDAPVPEITGIPPACFGEGSKLTMLENVSGEAVGLGCRGAFRVGEKVHVAMCLFERLRNVAFYEKLPPQEHFGDGRSEGMPDRDASRIGQLERQASSIHERPAIECPDRHGAVVVERSQD
jgi:hypothetical protein